ncbi:MAG: DHH family phosphoesterase [Taibaiella sp.]|nr:DHH family phosphoesterase [Taibaiella sp.]
MRAIQDAFPLLQSSKKIFITTHHKPDGDAIGSMLALYHYLVKKGHDVTAVSPSELPEFLMWMPGVNMLYNFEAESKVVLDILAQSDVIFGLDFNDFSRTKHMTLQLANARQPKIMLDHHLFPAPGWDYGMSIPEKSSTCEIIYDFINLCGDNSLIDQEISACLYTGVMTDTGSFRFPVTSAATHSMVADLKQKGLDHTHIHEEVYDSWSAARMRFLGYVLMEKMEVFPQYNAGLITLSRKDMKGYDVQSGDTEGLVNYPLNIANIKFATLITERPDEIKLSFRSKGDFDVSKFSREHFNGGGHFNASGGRSSETFIQTITHFKKILSDIHPQ